MPASPQLSIRPRHTALQTGVYAGVALSVIFVAWICVANRVPALEPFALERNLVAAVLLAVVALFPVARFLRDPARLWASSLLGWMIFSLTYWLLSLFYEGLREHFSGLQIFVLGGVANMVVGTVDWLGNMIWRAWTAAHSGPGHHPVN